MSTLVYVVGAIGSMVFMGCMVLKMLSIALDPNQKLYDKLPPYRVNAIGLILSAAIMLCSRFL